MRDYLEDLLEEQQEPKRENAALPEQPEAEGRFRRDGGAGPEGKDPPAAVQPFEIEEGQSAAPEGERSAEKRAGAADWVLETGLEPVAAPGAESAGRGNLAAAAPETAQSRRNAGAEVPAAERWSGAALYTELIRHETAAVWPESALRRAQPTPLRKPGNPPGSGTTLAGLDLAVRRDARRYDSPFPLY